MSMTQNGSPYDNANAERVNGILKQEFGLDELFDNRQQAEQELKESVLLYNRQRPHMSNHLLTPEQMHSQDLLKPKAWHKKTTRTLMGSDGFLPSPPII
ncbi:integrase core domain-containing protein [Flavitalea flava]